MHGCHTLVLCRKTVVDVFMYEYVGDHRWAEPRAPEQLVCVHCRERISACCQRKGTRCAVASDNTGIVENCAVRESGLSPACGGGVGQREVSGVRLSRARGELYPNGANVRPVCLSGRHRLRPAWERAGRPAASRDRYRRWIERSACWRASRMRASDGADRPRNRTQMASAFGPGRSVFPARPRWPMIHHPHQLIPLVPFGSCRSQAGHIELLW